MEKHAQGTICYTESPLHTIEGYVDLSRSQKAFVSARLHHVLNQHRHEALPRYADLVSQVQQRVQRGLTGEDLDWALSQYEELRRDLRGEDHVSGHEQREERRPRGHLPQHGVARMKRRRRSGSG